ncbi:tetratricopeptide repeat protein [Bartonella raoultii]|uniref:Tetratricopeptide repeat protein n=1 Tax=Bartonella raoultii TaxID=1457020 RepID=A0ABS7I7C1_9HYPH|nr:tetratricopeptide repeat protein [Bartonella raoultii]MBX4336101.1 tetratricopeptide repeat protein [Bartonella raoultii]
MLFILAALFLIFLASLLFRLLQFNDRTKNEKQDTMFEHYRYHMLSVTTNKHCTHDKKRHILKAFSILFVLLITWSIYGLTGNPEVKSYYFRELMDKDPQKLKRHEKLVRLQALFFRSPHDGRLADALAIGYLEENSFQEAVNMYLDALRLNGESAPRLVGYGLSLVGYEGGVITQEAQNAFQKAADLAPKDFYPRLLLADALRQAGKPAQAIQFLQNFLDTMPKDFSGRARVKAMIVQLRDSLN